MTDIIFQPDEMEGELALTILQASFYAMDKILDKKTLSVDNRLNVQPRSFR
jgi:hypothetical protein